MNQPPTGPPTEATNEAQQPQEQRPSYQPSQPLSPYQQWPPQSPSQPLPPQQYMQYPQPPFGPPPGPPSMPPVKRFSRRTLMIIGVIVLVLAILSGIMNVTKGTQTVTPTPTAQIQSTSSVTIATDTPTATQGPAALTEKGAIDAQLKSDISSLALVGDTVTAQYADHAAVLVGFQQQPDHAYLVALVQNECFSVQETVWQDPLLQNVNWLDYAVFAQDSQGLPVVLGECILHAQKAAGIIWSAWNAQSAWNQGIYENMILK